MLLTSSYQAQRQLLDDLAKDLHELTQNIGHDDMARTVAELRGRIFDPFMFVVVGEVKAGKSSFVNALLGTGQEICKVAPQPMTDTIQQIVFGESESTTVINPYLKRITVPAEILREIAIVDTPGTNTIVEHHQEVTERFIPAADLIVFVFEAKNPYRESSWKFFDFIHGDWQRKVVFVLQQKDLMPADDLAVNINGVTEQAQKKGIHAPHVFAVSAKDELSEKFDVSGFSALRDYIRSNITGGKAAALKLGNVVGTLGQILGRIASGLKDRANQWKADTAFRNDIASTLDSQEVRSNKEADILLENLLANYDRITRRAETQLSDGLNFPNLLKKSFSSMFFGGESAKDWLDGIRAELENDLARQLPAKLHNSVNELAESIQQMAKMIDLKIKASQTILRDDHEIFADIADRRTHVLRDLQETFSRFLSRTENFTDEKLLPTGSNIAPNVATGSGLAIIGIVLATVTSGSVLDITGGLLTAVGLAFAGVTVAVNRRKILESYRAEIARARQLMSEEIQEKLSTYIRNIKLRIGHNFAAFDHLLEQEQAQITKLENQLEAIRFRLSVFSEN